MVQSALESARLRRDYGTASPLYDMGEIISRVEEEERNTQALRSRMDEDLRKNWLLEAYQGPSEFKDNEEGFLHYTSNAPHTTAQKIISAIARSEMILKVRNEGQVQQNQRVNEAKEKAARGWLASVNEDLVNAFEPDFLTSLGWYLAVRGMCFARCLMTLEGGAVRPDITFLDPRGSTWLVTRRGLHWFCHKQRKTRDAILREYGVEIEGAHRSDPRQGVRVYDFYDGIINFVFTEHHDVLKPPTPHFSPRVPIAYAAAGVMPRLQSDTVVAAGRAFGESVWEANRGSVYDTLNFMMSVNLHLAAQARERTRLLYSRDGSFDLDEEQVSRPGAEIKLRTAQEEQYAEVPPPESTATVLNTLGLVSSEAQRGGISHANFGELPAPVSGFALNTLKSDIRDKIEPRADIGARFLKQCFNLLADQYGTALFPPMLVSGMDRGRQYFSQHITPQVVSAGGEYEVKLVPRLPKDNPAEIQMAQILRDGPNGVPLADDEWIWDNVLGIQDSQAMQDRIDAQMAGRMSPAARILTAIQAAHNQGDGQLLQVYINEWRMFMFMQWLQTQGILPPQLSIPTGAEQGSAANPGFGGQGRTVGQPQGTGFPASVSPPQANGIRNSPIRQQGPLVEQGRPRPGARRRPGGT